MKQTKSLIRTWENSYQATLGNVTEYKKRLRELSTWDKPLVPKSKDPFGHWKEWACKKISLQNLILEEYPNTVFTIDNRTIIKP